MLFEYKNTINLHLLNNLVTLGWKAIKNLNKNVKVSVRVKGLEPPRRKALDPKSSVSTNFTTPASGAQI